MGSCSTKPNFAFRSAHQNFLIAAPVENRNIYRTSRMIARPLYPLLIRPCPREVFPGTDFRVCKDLSLVSPIPCFGPAAHSLPLLLSLPLRVGVGAAIKGET